MRIGIAFGRFNPVTFFCVFAYSKQFIFRSDYVIVFFSEFRILYLFAGEVVGVVPNGYIDCHYSLTTNLPTILW